MKVSGKIILKPGREAAVLRRHPWVFSGGIARKDKLDNGAWVEVMDSKESTLGFGHYQDGSIMVRIVAFGAILSPTVYTDKLKLAFQLRLKAGIMQAGTTCYRLVHGEGDGLPGLIIDFYHQVAVIQAHSEGMHLDRHLIAEGLKSILGATLNAIYYKNTNAHAGEYLFGAALTPIAVKEHGHSFLVDWEAGQKTGFFLDQRENRNLLRQYVAGKRVLNTFCYTGGFSVYALNGDAALVHSVDASAQAIDICRKNLELNSYDSNTHTCFVADTFDFLKQADHYDVIVLDPPAFAKSIKSKHTATQAYKRLNIAGLKALAPNGILFTFSCSQVIDDVLFYNTVAAAAIETGRNIRVLHKLEQGPDHPTNIYHPEGHYLKGLVLFVE